MGVKKKGDKKLGVEKNWGWKKNKGEKKVGESGLRSSESCSPEGYGDP